MTVHVYRPGSIDTAPPAAAEPADILERPALTPGVWPAIDHRALARHAVAKLATLTQHLDPTRSHSLDVSSYGALTIQLHRDSDLRDAAELADRLELPEHTFRTAETGDVHHRWDGAVDGHAVQVVWIAP